MPSDSAICYHTGTMAMTRVQVQFTAEQSRALREIAAAEGRSMADLVREGVDALVRSRGRRSRAEIRERAIAAAGCARSGVKDLARRHDHYLAEAYGS